MSEFRRDLGFFRTLDKILLRTWIFGYVLLFIWLAAILVAGDFIQRVHGGMFGLSKHELELIHYCGMGLWKMLVLTFLFIPWLATRLVMRAERE
jgi:hypothetical protein